jgi:hypothetical protein
MSLFDSSTIFTVLILKLALVLPLIDEVSLVDHKRVIGAIGWVEDDPRLIHAISGRQLLGSEPISGKGLGHRVEGHMVSLGFIL